MPTCFCGHEAEYVGLTKADGCSNPECRWHKPSDTEFVDAWLDVSQEMTEPIVSRFTVRKPDHVNKFDIRVVGETGGMNGYLEAWLPTFLHERFFGEEICRPLLSSIGSHAGHAVLHFLSDMALDSVWSMMRKARMALPEDWNPSVDVDVDDGGHGVVIVVITVSCRVDG